MRTIAAIVAGAALGGAFMAAHSAQGPRLSVPQLVQSRAQFGFYGALLPNAAIWLLLLSTLVAADVTAGGTLAGLWHISLAQGVMVVCFVAWLLAVFGYRIPHNASRVIAVAALIMAGVLLARLAQRLGGTPPGPTAFGVSTWLPGVAWLAVIVLLLGTVAAVTVYLYSSVLTGLAIGSRNGGAAPAPVVRGIGAAVIMAVTGYVASGIQSGC